MMKFEFHEEEFLRVMAVGDAVEAFARFSPIPRKVADLLKKHIDRHETVMFGHAKFDDGRNLWTITYDHEARKNMRVKRTLIVEFNGNTIFNGNWVAKRALFKMEGRREMKLIKHVMMC